MATYVAGKFGYVMLAVAPGPATLVWAFSRWSYRPRCKILPKNTFVAGGYDDNEGGFIGADVRMEGPFDLAQTIPLVVGDVYVAALGITATGPVEFSLSVRVADVDLNNNAEDEPMWTINAVSKGAFNPAIPQSGALLAAARAQLEAARRNGGRQGGGFGSASGDVSRSASIEEVEGGTVKAPQEVSA
jgi:hypothetical protein